MDILQLILGITSGICLGTGVIYFFTGLRRPGGDRLHITFALFALAYGGAVATGLLAYKATTLSGYMIVSRWGGVFTCLTLIGLLWFVSIYTKVRHHIFLIGLSSVLSLLVVVALLRTNFIHTDIFGIVQFTLPWGETIALLDASESVWEIVFILSELAVIGYLIYAFVRQFLSGEKRDALVLGIGLLFLMFALVFDILFIDSGALNFIYLGDFGFLPLLIVMSVQLANQVIRTEEELVDYRQDLQGMVSERTAQLEAATQALRQSERAARALLDASPDTAMLATPEGVVLDSNQIGAARLGLEIDQVIGRNIFDIFESEIGALPKRKAAEVIASKRPLQWEDERDGRFFSNRIYPILDDGGEVGKLAIYALDITDRVQTERALREAAAAEERNRLARDLHDAVTQTIYSASLIAEVLPRIWERSPQEGQRSLVKLRQLVRGALAEMRTLLFELRPSALETASLETLLRQLGDALTGRTRVPVEVTVDGDAELPVEMKISLYRITQEAINNISKHSEATQAGISLQSEPEIVILKVWDNGCGFDPQVVPSERMGMVIMQERAASINAHLEIDSQPGQGTSVTLTKGYQNEEMRA